MGFKPWLSWTLVSMTVSVLAAEVFDAATESKVRAFVDETMKCRYTPGLAVAVVKGNNTWTSGYGTANFETGRRVDGQSLFVIGSLTKAFTMTLLGGLLQERGFKWTSKLSDVLGYRFEFVDQLRTKEMTIRDLLSHRTGLARLDLFGLASGTPRNETTREQFVKKLKYLPAMYEFRDQFLYNNNMYTLLGHVCESLGGDTWENLLRTRLLTPIGMTSTTVLSGPRDFKRDNMAKPYIYEDGHFKNGTADLYDLYPFDPAGAILSSAEDMAKWIRFNLDRGKTANGTQLIKEEMFAEAIKTTTSTPGGPVKRPAFPVTHFTKGYGYGWGQANYRGYDMYLHAGGWFCYVTNLWIYPDLNTGIFSAVNGPAFDSGKAQGALMYYLSDTVMGETPWLNTSTTCTFPQPWQILPIPKINTETTEPLVNGHDYVGVYSNALLHAVKVSLRNDSSRSEYLHVDVGRVSGHLLPTNETDRFLLEYTEPWEIARATVLPNNDTLKTNVTFTRDKGVVNAATFKFGVDVMYDKKPDTDVGTIIVG